MLEEHKAGDTSTISWLKTSLSDFQKLTFGIRKETKVVAELVTVLLASTETCRTGGTSCFFAEKLTQRFPMLMDSNRKNLCHENYS